jgi:hypothetical protein
VETTGQCELCRETRPLLLGHLLPAGLYRLLRDPSNKIDNPILISRQISIQTARQMRQPLLCAECEQRFSRNGETYVLPRLQNRKAFPLLDRFHLAIPAYESPSLVAFRGNAVGFDTEKIAYFGLSILWRASVRQWKTLKGQTTSVLPEKRFKESLRLYLLGETPLPRDLVVVATVATDMGSRESCFVPNRIKENPMVAYGLMTKGLYFRVLFGEDLPDGIRKMCCAGCDWKLLFVRDCQDNLLEGFRKLAETSAAVGRLRDAKSSPHKKAS